MRTLHLNLASRPYRNYTPVYGTALALAVLCVIFMIYNGQTAYRFFVSTKQTRAEIGRVESQIASEEQVAQQLEAEVKKVDLVKLNAESRFINAQIEDRAFSWSRLLDDMERVTPKDVRLASIDPSIDKDGAVRLTLRAEAKSHEAMIAFLRKLLDDPRFEGPFPDGETVKDDGTVTFGVSTAYLPAGGPGKVIE